VSIVEIDRYRCDPAKLESVMRARPGDVEELMERYRSLGALHHRFVARGQDLLLIDEWPSIEASTRFWLDPVAMRLAREAEIPLEPVEYGYFRSMTDPSEF